MRIPVNFRSLPRPSSPPDSLGIPRSPFSSFSRELQSLNTVAHRIQRLSSCLVFAYEIAVPNSQLEKTLELSTNYKLIFFSIFTSYSLSMLSMNCHALPAACAVFQKRLNYSYLNFYLEKFPSLALQPRARVGSHSKKEVFQPHLPVRLPCYDLAPITAFALGRSFRSRTSGATGFHGLTGGVYKARERIHRAMADARLLANPASWSRVADSSPN